MKNKIFLISMFMLTNVTNTSIYAFDRFHCDKTNTPRMVKQIANWDIIATNTGTIPTSSAFSGNNLIYSISTHPKSYKNKVTIDKNTGVIKVKAEKKDNFDITVKAINNCGTASNTFNVIIDEEE